MGIRGRLLTIVFAAVLPLPLFGLFFARENLIAFVLGGLAAGFCAGGAAILIARNVGGRLRLLEQAARKIEEGDFTGRLPVGLETGADEITALEKSFNRMAERLVERRNRFKELDTLKSDFVSSVSHATRANGSSARISSRTASEI